jgi:hypothetical protein
VTDPTEDVPANDPSGQSDSRLGLWALGRSMSRAKRGGTVIEFANQLDRTLKSKEAPVAVIANVHHVTAAGTATVENVLFPERKVRIRGSTVCHGVDLRVGKTKLRVFRLAR